MKIWFAGNSARKEREYLWQKAGAKNRLVSFFYLEDKKKNDKNYHRDKWRK